MKGVFTSSWLSRGRQWIASLVILFFSACPVTTYAQTLIDLPAPGTMVAQSQAFSPVMVRAIKIRPEEPLVFDFIVDNGNTGLEGSALKAEVERIAKYFLATVTIPEKDLWVNLSPYEKDRILPDELALTEMGRGMLSQDYILKQLASSLVHPDTDLGKEFWQRVYAKAKETLGTTEIPMDTFNKVWIVPEKAVVYERDNAAVLGETHLKLMMEEDYVAFKKGGEIKTDASDEERSAVSKVSSQIMREIVLPAIEQEVNQGENFALLRQMYGAMILATWYKETLKDSLLAQVYADQKKTAGVASNDRNMRERIFEQYVSAYRQGAFNFIREDRDPASGEVVPRKYFSGGEDFLDLSKKVGEQKQPLTEGAAVPSVGSVSEATIALQKAAADAGGVKDFEVATGVSYFKGEIKTTPITRPFRASEKNDVKDITELDPQNGLVAEEAGAESVARGEGAFFVLAAGAASRMSVALAPDDVKALAGGEEILSKAGVPVGKIDGKVVNYLDVFGSNVARFLETIDREASARGAQSSVDKNIVGIFTNDEYRPEHDRILAKSGYYGLGAGQVHLFHQPLGPKYVGTPEDVRKLESKFASPEAFQRALALAESVQAKIATGDREALKSVVIANERDPQGHGEFFHQLIVSGEFLSLFNQGKKWMAVKNIDNIAAKFDRAWLRTLGLFLNGKLDAQPEVSPRAPGQKGGSLIVMEDNGSHQLAEDPSLNATKDEQGKVKVSPTQSFWFNDAVSLFSMKYIMSIYKKDGQSDEDFISELRTADVAKREEIADRGRQKFPKLLDPKPAKKQDAVAVKIETNMWQSTGVVPQNVVVKAVGVRGARNFPIVAYPQMTREEKMVELAKLRFLGTKQWGLSDAEIAKARADLEKAVGRSVTDAELSLTLETYGGNKILTDDLLDYIWHEQLVTPGIFKNVDQNELSGEGDQAQADVRSADFQKMFLEKARAGEAVIGLVKPDGQPYEDSLVGEIRATGLRVTKGPKIRMSAEDARAFYAEHYDVFKATQGREKSWWPQLEALMTSGETTMLFIEGPGAVKVMTELKTKVRQSDGRYGKPDSTANRLHASDKTISAEREAGLMFDKLAKEQRSLAEKFPGLNTDAAQTRGGIDFDPALLNMQIERSGEGIRVHVDPAEIQRIKTGGVEGFAPVIINIMPVKGIIPALGLGDQSRKLAGVAG